MKRLMFILLSVALTAACQDKFESEVVADNGADVLEGGEYAISVEDALANLEAFIGADDFGTKSASRVVGSIIPVKYNSLKTKAVNDDIKCDNLLYIANFEQEQGYAVLAADTRISDKVIAIADEGSLSDATVYTAMELERSERIIVDGYPTTGPGFFTTPETGEEVFINPNTVSLYDESFGDTLVGNYCFDNNDTGVVSLADSDKKNLKACSTPELLSSSLCVSYAVNEIRIAERTATLIPDDDILIDGNSTVAPVTTRTEVSVSAWKDTLKTNLLLSKYSYWSQESPFNDLYPERRKNILFGDKEKAPAGCFPLAIAKILTHFKRPITYTVNGYAIDWEALDTSAFSSIGKISAAYLLRGISVGCSSWYFYQGTFTFPSKATKYMRFVGMNNAHSYNYSFDRVKNMIDKDCPLIIYSVPGISINKSHSWNIDGYKIKERTVTVNTYVGNVLTKTTSRKETCEMVHCDFGWGGDNNGYYVSGVFKMNDSDIEYDSLTNTNCTTNYNNLLKVIVYDKPL